MDTLSVGSIALLLLLALGIRTLYLSEFGAAPDFEQPDIDAGYVDDWARTMALDDWQRPAHLPDPEFDTQPFLRPPGYPYWLAALYSVSATGFRAWYRRCSADSQSSSRPSLEHLCTVAWGAGSQVLLSR
ncbi:MAG: hypothetical protein ACI841_004269 [Planctomycetota bacterium]|jgi:hypothetical protein